MAAQSEPEVADRLYLGNTAIVRQFLQDFMSGIIVAYDGYLRGVNPDAQEQINALIKEHGNAFMGRDPRYEIAPWQGIRQRYRIIEQIPKTTIKDDPGKSLFSHLALQGIKCAMSLAEGMDEEEAGELMGEILDDWTRFLMGNYW
jgi:hypothetical protein